VATADRNLAVDENYDWEDYSQAVDQALSDRDNWGMGSPIKASVK